jgi:pimeloyl-ACP methyl ester carboxylesterase
MPEGVSIIVLQGIPLRVVRRGAGRPLLLLHGGDGPQDHLPFFARLIEWFDVIAPVHPGFGGSEIPEHFDGMEDLVYLYLDLLEALNLRDVVLLGFSMGGWAAAEIAIRNTSRLSQLILADAVGIKPGDREARDIADIFGLPAPEVMQLMWHDPSRGPNLAAMTDEELTVLAGDRIAHAFYTWDSYMHDPKLKHRLHRIDVPTLLIWGTSDRIVTVAYAEAYRALIPGAQLVVVPEAGHLPQQEQPDRFVEHLLAFTTR